MAIHRTKFSQNVEGLTIRVLGANGENLTQSSGPTGDGIYAVEFSPVLDGKTHLYKAEMSLPGHAPAVYAFAYLEGPATSNLVTNVTENCDGLTQKLTVSVNGTINGVQRVSWEFYDYGSGRKLGEALSQPASFSSYSLPETFQGYIFAAATLIDNNGFSFYASGVFFLKGCQPVTTSPATTGPSTTVVAPEGCWRYKVVNNNQIAYSVVYTSCNGQVYQDVVAPNETKYYCAKPGQIQSYLPTTVESQECDDTAPVPTTSVPSTTEEPDYVTILPATVGYWRGGRQFARIVLDFDPLNVGPFDFNIIRTNGGGVLGQALSQTYLDGGNEIELVAQFVGQVTVQVRAKRGTATEADDILTTAQIIMPPAPSATTSTSVPSTTAPSTTATTTAPSTTFQPDNPFYPRENQPLPAGGKIIIKNSKVEFWFKPDEYGGAVYYGSRDGQKSRINLPFYPSSGEDKKGRAVGDGHYAYPFSFRDGDKEVSSQYPTFSFNVISAGNHFDQASILVAYAPITVDGKPGVYLKYIPPQWAIKSSYLPGYFEDWHWVDDIALHTMHHFQWQRTDGYNQPLRHMFQEEPYAYFTGDFNKGVVVKTGPMFSNAPTVDVPIVNIGADFVETYGVEGWAAVVNASGQANLVWRPDSDQFRIQYHGDHSKAYLPESALPTSGQSGYIAADPYQILGMYENRYYHYAVILANSLAEGRAYALSLPRQDHRPLYRFNNKESTRQMCHPYFATDLYVGFDRWLLKNHEVENGVETGNPNGINVFLPTKAVESAQVPIIYVWGGAKTDAGINKLRVYFAKAGQDHQNPTDFNDQYVEVTIVCDGTDRLYSVNMQSNSNYTGTIIRYATRFNGPVIFQDAYLLQIGYTPDLAPLPGAAPSTTVAATTIAAEETETKIVYAQDVNRQIVLNLRKVWQNGTIRFENTANPVIPNGYQAYYWVNDDFEHWKNDISQLGPFPPYSHLTITMLIMQGAQFWAYNPSTNNYLLSSGQAIIDVGYQSTNTPNI